MCKGEREVVEIGRLTKSVQILQTIGDRYLTVEGATNMQWEKTRMDSVELEILLCYTSVYQRLIFPNSVHREGPGAMTPQQR